MIHLPSPALIGVIHLPALPGTPRHQLPIDEILDRAREDARCLEACGFDAVIIENYGDAPFHADRIGPASVAAMAVVARQVIAETSLAVGINALRNDAEAAMGIAASVSAMFVRVNVHCGVYATDQGVIQGQADRTLRYRKRLGSKVAVFADVHVKHATPLGASNLECAAKDAAYRGLADALIVTGPATGAPVDAEDLSSVREAVPDRRVFVGSGATVETVGSLLHLCSGVIVGSSIKIDGRPEHPVDRERARAFVAAAGRD
ncbi:MAG: BtpA/SgcQ family protein [Phycisphaerae bacterium]